MTDKTLYVASAGQTHIPFQDNEGIPFVPFERPTQPEPPLAPLELTKEAIDKGDERYNMEVHNLFCNNCHSHCAYVLNVVKYKNRRNYNMISIWWMIVTKGKYVSFIGFVKSYIGFFIFLILVILIYKNFY